jgi:hypothetical protein
MTDYQDNQELKLRRLYLGVVLSVILMYFLGALFYADPFYIWQHALSELGTTKTLLGTPNMPSALIVTTGMFITGRLLLEAARVYRNNDTFSNRQIKSNLLYSASLGAFIAISPNDLMHTTHTIGSALLVGGTFLLSMIMVWDSRVYYNPDIISLVMILLSISVLFYALTYFSGLAIKQAAQKICLISILFVFYKRSRIPYNKNADGSYLHPAKG